MIYFKTMRLGILLFILTVAVHSQCQQKTNSAQVLILNGQQFCCELKKMRSIINKVKQTLGEFKVASWKCHSNIVYRMCQFCNTNFKNQSIDNIYRHHSQQLFDSCSEDYFVIDGSKKLKVCQDSDIVCSKLGDIVTAGNKGVFDLFDQLVGDLKCGNSTIEVGKIQENIEGNKTKTTSSYKKNTSDSNNKRQRQKTNKQQQHHKKQQKKKQQRPKTSNKKQKPTNYNFDHSLISTFIIILIVLYVIAMRVYKKYRRWIKSQEQ